MTIETIFNEYLNNEYSALFYTPVIYNDSFSYLFKNPNIIITAKNQDELINSFDLMEIQLKKGRIGYGFLKYEAGYYLENKFLKFRNYKDSTLLKFYFFDKEEVKKIKSSEIEFTPGGFEKKFKISSVTQNKSEKEFMNDIHRIKYFIEKGDTYQVNYTIKCKFKFEGSYSSLFKSLLFNQSAEFTALINDGENLIISVSPELFFSTDGNKIICKPMKGTIKRGINPADDLLLNNILQSDEKFHAENLMILDLLRNDLGRISKFNSVRVKHLYKAEKYESLFQLISEVRANLRDNISWREIFAGLFPCGSVTGAPKIRTMEIINDLEKENRGLYTGTIGLLEQNKAVFSVAIRTLTIDKKTGSGQLGIGSGITWDSDPASEYKETLLKSKFLTEPDDYFELFETMLIEHKEIFLLDYHLERLRQSASYFMFIYNETNLFNELPHLFLKVEPNKKYRLRLTLNKWGSSNFDLTDFPLAINHKKIIISKNKISTGNRFQYFKTSNRKMFDDEYKYYSNLGYIDVIFFNEANYLAEGAITNVFIRKENTWFTPSLDCGVLPGVYRRYFLEKNPSNALEKKITYKEFLEADEIMLTNSLRGEIKIDELVINTSKNRNFK
jgi:para-aminobenzoate synthetase/4-amino-4-deoxychorismate lyase